MHVHDNECVLLLPSLSFHPSPPPPLLPPDNEQLARSGTNCLENLSLALGPTFTSLTWDKLVQCMRAIFTASLPDQVSILYFSERSKL